MADDPVVVEFGAKIDKLLEGVDASKSAIGSLDGVVDKLASNFGQLGIIIAGAFSVGALSAFGKKMAEMVEEVTTAGQTLGLSNADSGNLANQAELLQVPLKEVVKIIRELDDNLNNKDPFSLASQAVKLLKIDVDKLTDSPVNTWFGQIAEAVSKVEPGLNRTAAVVALMGENGLKMIKDLDEGKKAFEHLDEIAAKTGATLSDTGSLMATKVGDNFRLLGLYSRGLANDLWDTVGPAVVSISEAFLMMADEMRKSYKEGGSTKILFDLIGEAAKVAASAVASLGAIVSGLGIAISAAWQAAQGNGKAIAEQTTKELEDIGSRWLAIIKKIWDEGERPKIKVTKDRQDIDGLNSDLRNETLGKAAALDAQVALQKGYQAQLNTIYQRDADLWQMTEQEKLRLSRAAMLDTYNVEAQALLDKRNLWAEGSRQWEVAEKQRLLAAQSATTEIIKINADMARNYKQQFDTVFGGLQSAFNGQLRGMLAGTTSFKDGFKNILGDMIIFFIQMVEKMVFQWIAGQLAMAAASAEGEAAKTSAAAAGSTARAALEGPEIIKSIVSSVGKLFASLSAWLTPELGPAAPAAAAATAAAVEASAMGYMSFAVGTDYVPYTGMAMVHEGEKIIPAEKNNDSGDGDVNITINAIDGASVKSMFMRNGSALVDALNRQRRMGRNIRSPMGA